MRTSWVSFTEKSLEEAQVQDWARLTRFFSVRNKDTCVRWVLLPSHSVLGSSLLRTVWLTGNAALEMNLVLL